MEYSPNFRQMDKAGHIKEKPINYWIIFVWKDSACN